MIVPIVGHNHLDVTDWDFSVRVSMIEGHCNYHFFKPVLSFNLWIIGTILLHSHNFLSGPLMEDSYLFFDRLYHHERELKRKVVSDTKLVFDVTPNKVPSDTTVVSDSLYERSVSESVEH